MKVLIFLCGFFIGAYVTTALWALDDMVDIAILGGHGNVMDEEEGEE